MIEINLSPRQKDNQLQNIGGMNLSLVNVKMLVIAILSVYILDPLLVSFYDDEISGVNNKLTKIRKEQRGISAKLLELKHIKKQVEDLNKQEIALSQRIDVVQKIVDKRQNPFKILKYIAENTPEDVWITELELDNVNLKLIGYSKTWKSIAEFLENLKSSIFFVKGIKYDKLSGDKGEYKGVRVEPFVITAVVERFK